MKLRFAVVIMIPLATFAPKVGALLKAILPSVHELLTRYTSNAPDVVTPLMFNRSTALLMLELVSPAGSAVKSKRM
jgi:hypothetical protein